MKLITNRRVYLVAGFVVLLLILFFFSNLSIIRTNSGGYDFFTHWYATRIYVKDGVDPYSDVAVSRLTSAMEDELDPGEDEVFRFAAPLFSIIFLTPFSLVGDFTIARAMWMTLLEISLVSIGWMFLNLITTNKKVTIFTILGIILLFSLPSVSAILSGSLTIIGLALFAIAAMLMVRQKDEAAGLLLAFSLVKTELFYPGVLLILVWAVFRGRKRIFWWFLGTYTLLMGFSILLIPDWVFSYLQVIMNYSGINPLQALPSTDAAMAFRLNLVKNLAVVLLLVFEWIVVKVQGKRKLAWNIVLLLLLLPWFGRGIHIEHTILYLPSLIITMGLFYDLWKDRTYIGILLLPIFLFILSWLFSGVFITEISIVLSRIIQYVVQPVIILVFLYWVRWWVLRSEKFRNPIIQN